MKKIAAALAVSAAAALCAANASAAGDIIRYCDTSAFINNYPIPCYEINDYCGIYVKDLAGYGFSVTFDAAASTVNITRDPNCTSITGIDGVTLPYQMPGAQYAVSGSTNIRVLLDGQETQSYWVDGYMMILLDNMTQYGEKYWDNDSKSLFLTIPDLPQREYAPLEKAKRTYTRIKTPSSMLDFSYYSQFPTEQHDWGFVRVEHDEPQLYDWEKSMVAKFDAHYMDQSKPHAVYLTFDEGYDAGYTTRVVEILKKYGVPATFFLTGNYVNERPDLVQLIIDSGFTVGNHTLNHANLAQSSTETIIYEIEALSDKLKYDFGYEMYYMRPPEGSFNEKTLAIAKDMGYNTILWSFAYYDYDTSDPPSAEDAYDMMTRYMHDGAIYLIHIVSEGNVAALESVIQYGIENGYEFRSLDDLCNP